MVIEAVLPRRSGKAVTGVVLGAAALLVCPILVAGQYIALISFAFINEDQGAGSASSIISILIVAAIAAIAIGLPVAALSLTVRARRDIHNASGSLSGSSIATVGGVLAVIALTLVLLGQLFMALNLAGLCSLDGCG